MGQKKNYSRYFIILQEDEKGYGLSADKLPTGYLKLEVKNEKCKISFYVQNLKSEMKPFNMILIFNKNNMHKKLIKLGDLNIDDTGKAEFNKEFDASNIAGTNIEIDKISGAAITKFIDVNMICVMKGFTSTEGLTDWKEYELVDLCKEKEQIEAQLPKAEANKFDEYEEKVEKSKEEVEFINSEEQKIIEESNESKPEEKCKYNEETKNDEMKYEDIDENEDKDEDQGRKQDEDQGIEQHKDEIEDEDEKQSDYDREIQNDFEEFKEDKTNNSAENQSLERDVSEGKQSSKSFEFFSNITEDLEPFEDEFEEVNKCKWFYVPVISLEDMYRAKSYNKFTVIYYPMVNYYPYIIRHGHYIIGYKYDNIGRVRYLVYAIPGTKAHYDQPFGGKYGFVSWTQLKHDKGKYGNMGYWLMFYDFRKSIVVIPVNK